MENRSVYVDRIIEEYFNTKWCFVDFFYAYCKAKGIDDPENDLDDETYGQLEEECERKINVGMLRRLREVITEDINERIQIVMDDIVRENQ